MEMQQRLYRPLPLLDTEGRLIESGYALAPLWEYDPQKVKMPKKTIKEEDTTVFFSDSAIFCTGWPSGTFAWRICAQPDLHRNQVTGDPVMWPLGSKTVTIQFHLRCNRRFWQDV